MNKEQIEKLKEVIRGLVLADHLGDVSREIPSLLELTGITFDEEAIGEHGDWADHLSDALFDSE